MSIEETAGNLGENVRELREARSLSQAQISKVAGIPRATWANLESGAANPTLQVLLRVASALQVRLDELLVPPRRSAKLHRVDSLPVRSRGAVRIRRLLPEPLAGLEIERLSLPPGSSFSGVPHTPGTREYLTCEEGEVELRVAGEAFVVRAGDVVGFAGDQRHGYRNPGSKSAVAYSVVAFAPTG